MLKTLKDLEKAIRLCRKLGVNAIEIGEVKFELGQAPVTYTPAKKQKVDQTLTGMTAPGGITEDVRIPTTAGFDAAGLTDEQLLFYSAGGDTQ